MDTLDYVLIIGAVVLGAAWWMRRKSRMSQDRRR